MTFTIFDAVANINNRINSNNNNNNNSRMSRYFHISHLVSLSLFIKPLILYSRIA